MLSRWTVELFKLGSNATSGPRPEPGSTDTSHVIVKKGRLGFSDVNVNPYPPSTLPFQSLTSTAHCQSSWHPIFRPSAPKPTATERAPSQQPPSPLGRAFGPIPSSNKRHASISRPPASRPQRQIRRKKSGKLGDGRSWRARARAHASPRT